MGKRDGGEGRSQNGMYGPDVNVVRTDRLRGLKLADLGIRIAREASDWGFTVAYARYPKLERDQIR